MRPTSASQRMASSLAFLKIPFRRLEKVTCRLVELSILRITIFPLPISLSSSWPSLDLLSQLAGWPEIYGDMIVTLQEQGRRQDLHAKPKKVIRRRRSGGSSRRRKLKSSRFPKGGREGKWTMLLVCAFVGRAMAFLGAGWKQLARRLSPICYLLYLARKGKPRGGRPDAHTQLATRPTSLISSQGFLYIISWWWC